MEGPEGVKWELRLNFYILGKAGKMKFNALGLGFNHLERAKQFLKWEWSFSLFTILYIHDIIFDYII